MASLEITQEREISKKTFCSLYYKQVIACDYLYTLSFLSRLVRASRALIFY